MTIEPVALAGYREVIVRDAEDRVQRHFVILPFAARWIAGEPRLNEELAEARWLRPAGLARAHHHRGPGRHRRGRVRAAGAGGVAFGPRSVGDRYGLAIAAAPADIPARCSSACSSLPGSFLPQRRRAARPKPAPPRMIATCSGSPKFSARCTTCGRCAGPTKARSGATRCRRWSRPRRRWASGATGWWRVSTAAIAASRQTYRTCTPAADLVIRRYLAEGAKISRDITARYAN